MTTGLRIPVGVSKSGRAAVETDEAAQMDKILFLALAEAGDDNPFQYVGMDAELIFGIKDASVKGLALQKLQRILSRFSDVIEVPKDSPITVNVENEGEVELSFSYKYLPTNEDREFRNTFSR
jgi:hypothetical protein